MFGTSSAMEKMLAGMLGMTPEQMAETLTDFRNTIVGVAETMKRIETKQDLILAHLQGKVVDNDDGSNRDSGGGSGDDGRGCGDSGTAAFIGTDRDAA